MDWTHLKPSDGRTMPWKNGGGITLELALEPPGASLETGFAWRLSTAEVGCSGPFSPFPGLERILWLLEGDGFDLDFGDRGWVDLRDPLLPVRFRGDWPAFAGLVGGPCVDLNLILDPSQFQASVESLRLTRPFRWRAEPASGLLFVARGTVAVPALDLHLGRRHVLRVDEGACDLELVPGYGGADLIAIRLEPLAT